MEHSNRFLSTVPTDGNEGRPIMDPRAWFLKLAIVRLELQQIDPTCCIRSLPPHYLPIWRFITVEFIGGNSRPGNRNDLTFKLAVLDAFALLLVMPRVEKNDNLREVFARALRSIREVFLHAGCSISGAGFFLKNHLPAMAASRPGSEQKYIDLDSKLAIAYTLHAFLTSVLHLLTSVFQYLIGYVDRGGSKTYSSGAFDFRDSFVSLVLFQGAYVWIKFRQAATPGSRKRKAPDVEHEVVDIETNNLKGLYRRRYKEKSPGAPPRVKYEPRFTPPRQEGGDCPELCSKRLPLGEYHTRVEAQIVLQIARYYYDKNGGCVELEDGRYKFSIPPMSEQEQGLAGKEKRKWVSRRAKQVGKQMYADFQREKGKHLNIMETEAGSHGAEFNEPSSSAPPLPCSSIPVLTAMVAEPAIASGAPSSPSLPLLPFDGAIVGDADGSCESLSDYCDMLAELICDSGLSNLLDQQSSVVSYQMQFERFAQVLGGPSLPEVGGVAGDIELDSERELNPSPSFQQGRDLADAGTENMDGRVFLPQSVPDLQQLVLCQKNCLEDNARQFVDLDHQLKASEIQNSRLQQEKELLQQEKEQFRQEKERLRQEKEQLQHEKGQLHIENESLKSRLEQVAKAQVATWTGIMIDIQQRN